MACLRQQAYTYTNMKSIPWRHLSLWIYDLIHTKSGNKQEWMVNILNAVDMS